MPNGFDPDYLVVHWVAETPIADLQTLLHEKLPTGDWVSQDEFRKLVNTACDQLRLLHGDCMQGQLSIAISRSLDQLALVELLPAQRSLNLSSEPPESAPSPVTKAGEFGADIRETIASAINISNSLIGRHESGEVINANEFLITIASSPDPTLTTNALKLAGENITAHGAAVSFDARSHDRFPRILESDERFHMRLIDFGEVGQNEVKAAFERLHIARQNSDSPVGRLFRNRQRVSVSISGCGDAGLFRILAAAELDIKVEVTATISTHDPSIERLTLVRILDKQESLEKLTRLISQLQLPLDGTI